MLPQAALALMSVTGLSPSFFLSSANQALACSMIETRYNLIRKWVALLHGRPPSLYVSFLAELDLSHPLLRFMSFLYLGDFLGMSGYNLGSSVVLISENSGMHF
jgi:hypothetical protein